ncbi:MAG: flavodoxin domain-containing protein [Nitrososphaerota archaeon]|jgi:flavorubredoxin|nr:flavodoxin domain-containing protein [Nitrososphaerota archaeon]
MPKVTLKNGINWVGVTDWNIRDFHDYVTSCGTSYNAYLIQDEKIALVDTVKATFCKELIAHISELTTLEKIDYIIVNHVEMDHSSSLPIIAELAKNAKICATARGKEELIKHYGAAFERVETVKSGDKISLGKKTLTFLEAPMLHWPDSMFTYIIEDKVLMPNDAFGQHLASSGHFDDEVDQERLMKEAITYYSNILTPFAPLIVKKLQEVIDIKLPIDIIAPSHGIIWRKDPMKIVNAYMDWSTGKVVKQKVSIVFDTMWDSTNKMARAISDGIASQGVEVKLFKLRCTENTDIVTEITDSKVVLVGSPTLNNGIFPSVSMFLTYITGLKPKDKLWGFFGSYGWGGGAVRGMVKVANEAGFEVIDLGIELKWVPTEAELKKCFDYGVQIAQKVKA